ncbi:5'/3'-nucleotidase SurE [Chelatococcus sambhunathii]|uniref:5'-nucleotidase SurE n=1 Tax=Chelatococcus sambhunathii TaxID=363953 RepID=A0ABU1DJX2_9HYPH|nr:5'/3'-nucleotidase SurE [Chelatococcus sambhunathii]MDR4308422.1 5'/3'-nucleotidase SurE [Chelatococcus sambhunathii]
MRILLTNDDGINAPGLEALEEIAREISDDVWIVAPEADQSGASHSISISDPLRLREIGDKRFAVRGTPSDCVIMGLRHVLGDRRPDVVLSGVNRGQNVAEDVTYSGTIAGAIEGTILGVRSIALSQNLNRAREDLDDPFAVARAHGADVIRRILKVGEFGRDRLVNVNFPGCLPDEVKGVQITHQGQRDQELLKIERRVDGRGNPYFWIVFGQAEYKAVEGADLAAIRSGRISVTPLKIDLTDEVLVDRLKAAFDD